MTDNEYELLTKRIDITDKDVRDNRNNIVINRSDIVVQEVQISTILDKLDTLIDKIDANQQRFNRFILGVVSGVVITVIGGFVLALILQKFMIV